MMKCMYDTYVISRGCRICDSQRHAISAVQVSRSTAGDASSKRRRKRSFRGKSGPPTHHGSVTLKTRGMYEVSNCFSRTEPVCIFRSEKPEKASIRLPSTSLLASESRCGTRICGRVRRISLSKFDSEKIRSAGVAGLSTPRKGSSAFSSPSTMPTIPSGTAGSIPPATLAASCRALSSTSSMVPRW